MKFIAILIILIFGFLQETRSEADPETKKKPEIKKIKIWEGEVLGVYKDKGKVRINIYPGNYFHGKNSEEIKKGILEKKEFELRQKGTGKRIGTFFAYKVETEEIPGIQKNLQLILRGNFKVLPGHRALLSTDTYIASYMLEESYIEPLHYFNDRITGIQKSIIHPKDKKEMLLIEGGNDKGYFLHGQGVDPSMDNFNPNFASPTLSTLLDLPSFYMDKYEVTNREYSQFLKETNMQPPPNWIKGNFPAGKENHPVDNISFREAENYAKWSGKRLPTEFEWEKAARGPGVQIEVNRDESYSIEEVSIRYPFADQFDSQLCNTRETGLGGTISVFELASKGASPYGLIGMCGNVAEWTSSWFNAYEGHYIANYAFGKQYKVIRGGSYADSKKESTVYHRSYGGIPNLTKDRKAGFRLVVDAKPK